MQLQIGVGDFGKARTKNLKIVDKTLFIKEVLDNRGVEVSLITRPRRFGKTFNLSMLHYFLAAQVNGESTVGLFDGLNIATVDNSAYMQHQGKYPVIFISFKDIKSNTFDVMNVELKNYLDMVFQNYQYLATSDKLTPREKFSFDNYFSKENYIAVDLKNALFFLCKLLYKHHGVKPWLLIDEYDTPIQSGYLNNYYNEITDLMRGMLGVALKDNIYLERAVLTGILRIAKESLFSGLNNPCIYSILDTEYSQHFGFTQTEVQDLLRLAGLDSKEAEVRQWYNGYVFGGNTIYNPWSIVNYINRKGILQAYWVNTSDDKLIRDVLLYSDAQLKQQAVSLLKGETVIQEIDENMVFGNLKTNKLAVWSLLLMSGYLKVTSFIINDRGEKICQLAIPNQELQTLYRDMIESWLSDNDDSGSWYRNFLSGLLTGDIASFEQDFGQILAKTVSCHDAARTPENFYHGFMLGLTASLRPTEYEVKSNKESGFGRYDLVILPKDLTKYAIIFEFKSICSSKEDQAVLLVEGAKVALAQIDQKQYLVEAQQRGYKNILKIGLAFSHKKFSLAAIGGISSSYED